jgi:rsbT co-antagonist protein RsbR
MKNQSIDIFRSSTDKILDLWMTMMLADAELRDDLMTPDDLRAQSEELLTALVASLNDQNIANPGSGSFSPVIDILDGISLSRAKQGFSPRETGVYIFSLKDALLKILQDTIKSADDLYAQSTLIIKLIDNFGIITFERFIHGREDVVRRQVSEIDDISTPVIQVWDGILALPIIGTLDSARTQIVMEGLLQNLVDTGSAVAILDISGVPAVDSLVAANLLKTVSACRLMGAECIISGIRPEIAQTIVHMGIDLSGVITKPSLAGALKTAFQLFHLRVVNKSTDQR